MNIQITGNRFEIRKKFLKLFGMDFSIYDGMGQMILFAHLKAFKLKEDITLYKDNAKTQPVINIRARSIIDFSAAYDFVDMTTGLKFGAAKRKGWKSILRDEWIIMDVDDREVGVLQEDSGLMALVRRLVTNLIPQTFYVTINGQQSVTYKNNFNPILSRVRIHIDREDAAFPPAFAIAMGVLLCAIEGKQG